MPEQDKLQITSAKQRIKLIFLSIEEVNYDLFNNIVESIKFFNKYDYSFYNIFKKKKKLFFNSFENFQFIFKITNIIILLPTIQSQTANLFYLE